MKGALVKKIPASATLVFIALSALAVLLNHSGLLAPRPGDAPPLLSYGDPSAATLAALDALEAEAAASGVRRAALCITGPVRSLLLAPVYHRPAAGGTAARCQRQRRRVPVFGGGAPGALLDLNP